MTSEAEKDKNVRYFHYDYQLTFSCIPIDKQIDLIDDKFGLIFVPAGSVTLLTKANHFRQWISLWHARDRLI